MRHMLFPAAVVMLAACSSGVPAQAPKDIALPAPVTTGGRPLMDVLADRQTGREYAERELGAQVLSDLLWAAWGVNREDGRRTAPSARNWQEIDLYVVTKDGAYLYDAPENLLRGVKAGDLRGATGGQPFVPTAPLNLVYVAVVERMGNIPPEAIDQYSWADAAFISQNVYLYCASEGLATVVRGAIDRKAIAEAFDLPEGMRVVMAQSVGYPAGE